MSFTVSDRDFFTEIQYLLIETTDGGLVYGSVLYSAAEVTAKLNYRILDFYKRTNIIAKRDTSIVTVIDTRDQTYPSDMIDIIRLGIEPQVPC